MYDGAWQKEKEGPDEGRGARAFLHLHGVSCRCNYSPGERALMASCHFIAWQVSIREQRRYT